MKGRSGAGPGSVRAGGAGGRQGAAHRGSARAARSASAARSAALAGHERSEFRSGGSGRGATAPARWVVTGSGRTSDRHPPSRRRRWSGPRCGRSGRRRGSGGSGGTVGTVGTVGGWMSLPRRTRPRWRVTRWGWAGRSVGRTSSSPCASTTPHCSGCDGCCAGRERRRASSTMSPPVGPLSTDSLWDWLPEVSGRRLPWSSRRPEFTPTVPPGVIEG